MTFNWIDFIVLAVLAVGAIRGWRAGFIVMVGNIASLVVGVVATAWIFSMLSSWHVLANWHIGHPIVTVIVFLLILAIVVKLLRLVVKLLNGIYRIISIIPGMGLTQRRTRQRDWPRTGRSRIGACDVSAFECRACFGTHHVDDVGAT